MPTGMSLPSFGSATSRGYRGVSQANKSLHLTAAALRLSKVQRLTGGRRG